MFRNALTLGQIAGIRVAVHYSWLLVLLFVTWSLGGGFFPQEYRDWPPAVYWIAGGAASLLLLLSVLLHELGHSLVARARGVRVLGITLFLFGGVSTLEDEAASARDEFLIAIAGPATSVALAAGCWALATALPGNGAPRATLSYAATLNLVLGAFNLLPGFPLDGGRVLRAAIWRLSGSQSRGTRVASYAGQGVGLLLVLWGLFQALNGGLLSGLWSALIGWFLQRGRRPGPAGPGPARPPGGGAGAGPDAPRAGGGAGGDEPGGAGPPLRPVPGAGGPPGGGGRASGGAGRRLRRRRGAARRLGGHHGGPGDDPAPLARGGPARRPRRGAGHPDPGETCSTCRWWTERGSWWASSPARTSGAISATGPVARPGGPPVTARSQAARSTRRG